MCADNNSRTKNASAPFLMLPQEIKNEIYKLVLGGHLIHIQQKRCGDRIKMDHRICYANVSEDQVLQKFTEAQADKWVYWNSHTFEDTNSRHEKCGGEEHGWPHRINVGLLLASSHLYHETRFIPLYYNTFSFSGGRVLRKFLHTVRNSAKSRNAIRSLHLNISYHDNKVRGLRNMIEILISRLQSIERLHLNINQPTLWSHTADNGQKVAAMKPMYEALKLLGGLPLKKIGIIVTDPALEEKVTGITRGAITRHVPPKLSHRWTVGERRAWAEKLTQEILK